MAKGSKGSGRNPWVEIGHLLVTYLPGASGATDPQGWVLRADFERLHEIVSAYQIARQLRYLVARDDRAEGVSEVILDILRESGVDIRRVPRTPPIRRLFNLTLYRLRENSTGLVPISTISVPAFAVARVNLFDIRMATAPDLA